MHAIDSIPAAPPLAVYDANRDRICSPFVSDSHRFRTQARVSQRAQWKIDFERTMISMARPRSGERCVRFCEQEQWGIDRDLSSLRSTIDEPTRWTCADSCIITFRCINWANRVALTFIPRKDLESERRRMRLVAFRSEDGTYRGGGSC